jgi:hypothetical protein
MNRESVEALIGVIGPFLKNASGTGRPTNDVKNSFRQFYGY